MRQDPVGGLAVVQEWLDAAAGSEKVFAELARIFPKADLYALSETPGHGIDLGGRPVVTTVLDHAALRDRRGLTLPFMPLAWRALGENVHDWSLTVQHAFAHSHRLAPAEHSMVYVMSPARYVWYPELDGRGAGALMAPARALLKRVDRRIARRPAFLAGNSTEVTQRIKECWGRDSVVLFPPVDTTFFATPTAEELSIEGVPAGHLDGAVLFVGRLIAYKRPELAIALGEAMDRPVVLVGSGPMEHELRRLAESARVPVHLLVGISGHQLRDIYARAGLLAFLGREDFGIVPVEAMAAGTPVLALDAGGARDTVQNGLSGQRVSTVGMGTLVAVAREVETVSAESCRQVATTFSAAAFRKRLLGWCADAGMPLSGSTPII